MRRIKPFLLVLAIVVAGLVLGVYMEDESTAPDSTSLDPVAHVTLDDVGCTYEGDDTPKAPAFYLGLNNQTSSVSYVEVNRVPADVATADVERFFELQQALLEQGEAFRGLPEEWRLNRRASQTTVTGSMLVGDPTFPDQMLVAGQRYVVWCSTGEPPTRVFFAKVVEPTE